ncbi:MAG: KpsF/GutQ family sugar-phosphate isomerase [Gammaproteobacteria bacterium]|nr:KpsF/GutQ family sugar-phosphate isomerase [Gammaproteobacteria bacterium]
MSEHSKHTSRPLKDAAAVCAQAKQVLAIESAAIAALENRIDKHFIAACHALLNCTGRIVVCGVGKSGHIGHKIAATLASTGSPAFFVHAAEASHGDLGMLQQGDVLLAISYSGTSQELLTLIPGLKRMGVPIISLCGESESPLVQSSDIYLDVSVSQEACPLNLAPTASTTATLAMGDALAISLLRERGFDEGDFARSHPGGRLGRRLLLRVSDIMVTGDQLPVVSETSTLSDALLEVTNKGLGIVAIVSDENVLRGLFTDGDLRRTIDRQIDIRTTLIKNVMTTGGQTIEAEALAVDALGKMQQYKITALMVLKNQKLHGIVTMHQLLASGVV